jgi:hypothetical protein
LSPSSVVLSVRPSGIGLYSVGAFTRLDVPELSGTFHAELALAQRHTKSLLFVRSRRLRHYLRHQEK